MAWHMPRTSHTRHSTSTHGCEYTCTLVGTGTHGMHTRAHTCTGYPGTHGYLHADIPIIRQLHTPEHSAAYLCTNAHSQVTADRHQETLAHTAHMLTNPHWTHAQNETRAHRHSSAHSDCMQGAFACTHTGTRLYLSAPSSVYTEVRAEPCFTLAVWGGRVVPMCGCICLPS